MNTQADIRIISCFVSLRVFFVSLCAIVYQILIIAQRDMNKSQRRFISCNIFFLLLILFTLPGCRPEQDIKTIKVGLTHSRSHSFSQALDIFAELLAERSGGKYEVDIFHSAQIGNEKEMQEMLTIGSLEICLSGVLNTYEPLFTIFEMPYLYRDREHIFNVNNGPVMQEISASLEKHGIVLIGFYENGFRNISNSIKPIEKPEDVRGMKIRTPENPAQIQTFRTLGAIPTPLSFSELYTALVQGVIDGQENPLQNIWYGRLYESQKYIAITHHIYNSLYITVSKKFWDRIPDEDRKLIKSCIDESSKWQLEYMKNLDQELIKKMEGEGVTFTYPDQKAFARATMPAYEKIYEVLGDEAGKYVEMIRNME